MGSGNGSRYDRKADRRERGNKLEREPQRRVQIRIENRSGDNGTAVATKCLCNGATERRGKNSEIDPEEEASSNIMTRASIMIDQANATSGKLENILTTVGKYQSRTGNSTKTSQATKEIDRLLAKAYCIGMTAEEARGLMKEGLGDDAEGTALAKIEYADNQLDNLLATVNLLEVVGEL